VKPIAFLAVLAASAVAGHWDVEKVDSAGWGAAVDMRWHPDGRLFLCYSDTTGVIRLASKDSIWSYEDLPQWRSAIPGSQAFDIDHHGTIGVSYVSSGGRNCCALRSDTSWVDISTPFRSSATPIAIDTAGNPAIITQFGVGETLLLARMQDTQWVTTALMAGEQYMNPWFGCSDLGSMSDGTIWGVFCYSYSYPKRLIIGTALYSFLVQDTQVDVAGIASGVTIGARSGCVDEHGVVHASYDYLDFGGASGFGLDGALIDSVMLHRTAVRYDWQRRAQIAYVPRDDTLMYRYLDAGVWHIFNLKTTGLSALSLAIDKNPEPLIAYTTSEGVFLARGIGITGLGVEQRQPTAFGSRFAATVVRKVLRIPDSPIISRTSLFDMTGRRVTDLHPGANDVSGLSPGVYFVREPQTQAVRKVVLTR
jgi:hypothetical protein